MYYELQKKENICCRSYIIQIYSTITRGRVFSGELYAQRFQKLIYHIIQICSEIARGRVLSDELYAQRLQKLIYNS